MENIDNMKIMEDSLNSNIDESELRDLMASIAKEADAEVKKEEEMKIAAARNDDSDFISKTQLPFSTNQQGITSGAQILQSNQSVPTNPRFSMRQRPRIIQRVPLASTTSAATSNGQNKIKMTAKDMVLKCKTFFNAILSLWKREVGPTENMTIVVQELIDAKISSAEFCNRLRQLMKVDSQSSLLLFLNTSLPLIRQALIRGDVSIEGINPPPPSRNIDTAKAKNVTTMSLNPIIPIASSSQLCSTTQLQFRPIASSSQLFSTSQIQLRPIASSSQPFSTSQVQLRPIPFSALRFAPNYRLGRPRPLLGQPGVLPMQQRFLVKQIRGVRQPKISNFQMQPRPSQLVPNSHIIRKPVQVSTSIVKVSIPKVIRTSAPSQMQQQPSFNISIPITPNLTTPPVIPETAPNNSDELMVAGITNIADFNDVTVMGGVNLAKENQLMLNSVNSVGSQERTCKEAFLLNMPGLQNRMKSILAAKGFSKFDREVCEVMSHALQEKLTNLLEDLAFLTEERLKIMEKMYRNRKKANEDSSLETSDSEENDARDLESEEVPREREAPPELDEDLKFNSSQTSDVGNTNLDLYLNDRIKVAELEDLEVIFKVNNEYRRDRPYIWRLSNKLKATVLHG